jgi:hypothetical protein
MHPHTHTHTNTLTQAKNMVMSVELSHTRLVHTGYGDGCNIRGAIAHTALYIGTTHEDAAVFQGANALLMFDPEHS